jgi:RNA polymerase subunit RPABC4/transcription elongation factor Spt4
MREPRLEPEACDLGSCPYCGRDDIKLDWGFCKDCKSYMTRDQSNYVEDFNDWLDHIFEDKLKAQGYL